VPEISIDDAFSKDAMDADGNQIVQAASSGGPRSTVGDQVAAGQSPSGDADLTHQGDGGRLSRSSDRRGSRPVSGARERVEIPRWAIYLQGALLGLTATTFFIFGMAVGDSTGGGSTVQSNGNCVVSGAVYYDRGSERLADTGAVVILLPVDAAPRERPDASGLRPEQFSAVRNQAIDEIRAMGGSIVRADQDGKFQTELPGKQSYWLLVISRNQQAANDTISKQTRAELGTYFLPIESLLDDRDFLWQKVRFSGPSQALQDVTF